MPLVHTEEAKRKISEGAKGAGRGGFNVRINCPHCQQEMSPANLAKHENVCLNSRGMFLNGKELSVKEQKVLRRICRSYGTTFDVYLALHNEQDGKCEICGRESFRGRLSINHCHSTGNFRGLLCEKCNNALGMMNDDQSLLQGLIDYLNKHKNE